MILKNATIKGKVQDLAYENGKIVDVAVANQAESIDLHGKRVIPGLVDIHTHGCFGYNVLNADFEPMCRFYGEHGTTSWLPTTETKSFETLKNVTEAKTNFPGARILGYHFEGPYLCEQYKGGMDPKYLRNPSADEFRQYRNVKMITLAPELPGAMEFIQEFSPECVASLGHTACNYQTALEAIDAGAKCLTHTFNAMTPLNHREPGPIGAAIDKNIYVQFICDGFHIAKPIIMGAYRIFGPERMVLISDSVPCAYLPDGDYDEDGLIKCVRDGKVRLQDGTIAGSSATLWDCVKKAVEFGIPFDEAVQMATQTPSELINVKKGRIQEGWDADLLIIDDDMEINTVIIDGNIFWTR